MGVTKIFGHFSVRSKSPNTPVHWLPSAQPYPLQHLNATSSFAATHLERHQRTILQRLLAVDLTEEETYVNATEGKVLRLPVRVAMMTFGAVSRLCILRYFWRTMVLSQGGFIGSNSSFFEHEEQGSISVLLPAAARGAVDLCLSRNRHVPPRIYGGLKGRSCAACLIVLSR